MDQYSVPVLQAHVGDDLAIDYRMFIRSDDT